ncbi:MAG: hypothetical protein AAB729_05080, partial [Patescibacteria group bacterium]
MSFKIKGFFCVLIVVVGVILSASIARADVVANRIVISQVQIEGDNAANDEFVEIYNPTESCVTL